MLENSAYVIYEYYLSNFVLLVTERRMKRRRTHPMVESWNKGF